MTPPGFRCLELVGHRCRSHCRPGAGAGSDSETQVPRPMWDRGTEPSHVSSFLLGAPNRSLFEPARPAVSRRELVIAGEFFDVIRSPWETSARPKERGSVIEDPELPGLLLAQGDRQTSNLSDFYPISICGRVGNTSAGGTSGSGGLIIRWSLVRVQPAPRKSAKVHVRAHILSR
jgi:hypothetical protein